MNRLIVAMLLGLDTNEMRELCRLLEQVRDNPGRLINEPASELTA